VIPVYNENQSISESVVALASGTSHYKLLFVEDGSTDGTLKTLSELKSEYGFELIVHEINLGYGAACRSGAAWAISKQYEWIIFADSDLTNSPNEIVNLSKAVLSGNSDVYKASRFITQRDKKLVTRIRKGLSTSAKYLTCLFLGLKIEDPTNGFRAIRADLYSQFRLSSMDFSLIMEEVCEYLRLGASISNFDAYLGIRNVNQRASSFRYNPKLLQNYLYWCQRCFFQRLNIYFQKFKGRPN
jgi:glycosyltransferase involved in cell wall biosynthesis